MTIQEFINDLVNKGVKEVKWELPKKITESTPQVEFYMAFQNFLGTMFNEGTIEFNSNISSEVLEKTYNYCGVKLIFHFI